MLRFRSFDALPTCHVPPRSRYSLCSAAGFDVMHTRNELRIEEEEEEEEEEELHVDIARLNHNSRLLVYPCLFLAEEHSSFAALGPKLAFISKACSSSFRSR